MTLEHSVNRGDGNVYTAYQDVNPCCLILNRVGGLKHLTNWASLAEDHELQDKTPKHNGHNRTWH